MPNAADKKLRRIIGRALITAAVINQSTINRILNVLADVWRGKITGRGWVPGVLQHLTTGAEVLGRHFAYVDTISWVTGQAWMFNLFPRSLKDEFPLIPPDEPTRLFTDFDAPEEVRFPRIEQAAERLLERNVMTRPDFDDATQAARDRAFTVAGNIQTDGIETVQNVLAEGIVEGTSLKRFKAETKDKLDVSFLGEGHQENVYRTGVQSAFRDGRETLMSNPVVDAMFPYQQHIAISDDRVRDDHHALNTMGLDGLGIWRRDDPFWDRGTAPLGYQCRCLDKPMTIEQAARAGVTEAIRWRDSGIEPSPTWVETDFEPYPGFGSRGRTGAALV